MDIYTSKLRYFVAHQYKKKKRKIKNTMYIL